MKPRNLRSILFLFCVLLVCNIVANQYPLRFDLTEDHRHTLSQQSINKIKELENTLYIKFYFEGELPFSLLRLRQAVNDILLEMERVGCGKVEVIRANPQEMIQKSSAKEVYEYLRTQHILPFTYQEYTKDGAIKQNEVYPSALLSYKGKQRAVNFLTGMGSQSIEKEINTAIDNIEYELSSAISELLVPKRKNIAFISGHQELDYLHIADAIRELSLRYNVFNVKLNGSITALDTFDVAIIAKPQKDWNEVDKFTLDQFIMRNGRVAFFIDAVHVHTDSLASGSSTFGFFSSVNLEDMLFKYGVRITPTIIQDLQCALIPVNISLPEEPPKFKPVPWTYNPILNSTNHTAVRGVSLVKSEFPSKIDTLPSVKNRKSVLLTSSGRATLKSVPAFISLKEIEQPINEQLYQYSSLPVAVLIEGNLSSCFQNRNFENYTKGIDFTFTPQTTGGRIAVVGDGDIIANEVRADGSIFPLGYDKYAKQLIYGNAGFIKNLVSYLAEDEDVLFLRSRTFTHRFLDKVKLIAYKTQLQWATLIVPILMLTLLQVGYWLLRRKKYGYKKKCRVHL